MEYILYLTDYCNLKCSYCYQGDEKKFTHLDDEKLERALDFMIKNSIKGEKINLTFLGGEPLLKKDLIYKALDIIKNKYPKYKDLFKYNITTNCTLSDDKLIKLFKENNFDVRVSIDGDKETHNLNRVSIDGKDKYDCILDNIKKVKSSNIKQSIRMTVTKNNIHLLYKNVLYFYELGFRNFCLGLDYFADWKKEDIKEIDNQLELVSDFYLDKLENKDSLTIDLFDGKFTSIIIDRPALFCNAGTQCHLTINSLGELYPCTYVANDNKWNIGNIVDGLNLKKFYNTIKDSVCKDIPCTNCDIKFTCHGRKCGFLNYSQTKILNKSSDNLCMIEKLVYKHNKVILRELYKKENQRLTSILEQVKAKDLKLTNAFEEIIGVCVNEN